MREDFNEFPDCNGLKESLHIGWSSPDCSETVRPPSTCSSYSTKAYPTRMKGRLVLWLLLEIELWVMRERSPEPRWALVSHPAGSLGPVCRPLNAFTSGFSGPRAVSVIGKTQHPDVAFLWASVFSPVKWGDTCCGLTEKEQWGSTGTHFRRLWGPWLGS